MQFVDMIVGNSGQQKILKRLADEKNLSHGYLFFGPEGIGKKQIALHLASYLETGDWNHAPMLLDAFVIEPESGDTIGIDAARDLAAYLRVSPLKSSRRVGIVDNADALTPEAQNALLKITEEAPESSMVIYISHDPDALLPTLLSRLHRVYFGPLSHREMENMVGEFKKVSAEERKRILAQSRGAPGIAWRLMHDKRFLSDLETADEFRNVSERNFGAFLKKITDRESFDIKRLLDALLVLAASDAAGSPKNSRVWHALLTLRGDIEYYNLNPKIQLRALHMRIAG